MPARSDAKAVKGNAAAKKSSKKPRQAAGATVACWEDDPGDPKDQAARQPIVVPAPAASTAPLAFKISGTAPAPQVYQPGTASFRYYAAACALRRTADFWGPIVPAGTQWEIGKTLPVLLDDGVDLNAYYTRGDFNEAAGLHFFHSPSGGTTVFSGESPDVVCHEMGHAVLDAIRPQLFDAQAIEAAAFHESFGDMSAMLCALQVPSFRQAVMAETSGTLNRVSRLSRLAEQLGAAIRAQRPDLVDADCLRNAVNSFFYRDPQTLPPAAPATQLSSEPHSFSRVFTAAFLDLLAGVFKLQGDAPTADDLVTASQDAARLLVAAILEAPVVPDYYSQVAAHMVSVGENPPFSGKYRNAVKSAFVRRGILSLDAATTVSSATSNKGAAPRRFAADAGSQRGSELPEAAISSAHYGLRQASLKVRIAGQPKQFAVTSAALTLGPLEPRSPQNAAQSFTEDLFQRGRVDVGKFANPETDLGHTFSAKTHVVVEERGDLLLRRRTFDCGFD
jgi:hypothetical protein